ncbi:MAG: polysaccharide biosynthesis/export family protein [Lentisphaeria bacterium]
MTFPRLAVATWLLVAAGAGIVAAELPAPAASAPAVKPAVTTPAAPAPAAGPAGKNAAAPRPGPGAKPKMAPLSPEEAVANPAATVAVVQPLQPAAGAAGGVQVARLQIKRNPYITGITPSTGDYRLNVGDTLALTIYGLGNTYRVVPIDPSGMITYLAVGSVRAAGRTIDELHEDLQKRLSEQFVDPLITVVPARFRSQNYTILGQVNYPGTYPIAGRTTVVTALCAGRGFKVTLFRNSTIQTQDFSHSTLLRRGGQFIPVDFEALVTKGDASQDVELQDGDVINIPSAVSRNIYVLGEVGLQRSVGFYGATSLLQVLTEARGIRAASAGDTLLVIRGSLVKPETYALRVSSLFKGRGLDMELRAGDIVYVPPRKFSLLEDMVKAAVNSFATNLSVQAADDLYDQIDSDNENTNKNTVIVSP